MPIDSKSFGSWIKTLSSFTPAQWTVMISIVTTTVSAAFWIENRYAKIEEINERFQKSQQQLESAHFLSLEIFGQLPETQRKQILEKLEVSKQNRNKNLQE